MEAVQQLMAPLILLPLMFVVGLQLTPADFQRVMDSPRAVLGGTLGQLIMLPLMTWGIVTVFGISPILAVGAVLLAATPGAGMSNVMAAISGANVALSVTLTAIASLLSVISMPLMASLGLSLFMGGDAEVNIPLATLFTQLVLFLAIPIGLGMLARARWPETATRYVSPANRFAVLAILILTPFSAYASREMIPSGSDFLAALGTGVVWTLAAMSIGWSVASLLGLGRNDRFTFLIEFSARNIAMTFIVAAGSLGRLDLALFAVAYSMTGFPMVIVLSILRGRRKRRKEQSAAGFGLESREAPAD
jgi:BASS family bile acid:Na+ symporter